jgi:hypothetical protein
MMSAVEPGVYGRLVTMDAGLNKLSMIFEGNMDSTPLEVNQHVTQLFVRSVTLVPASTSFAKFPALERFKENEVHGLTDNFRAVPADERAQAIEAFRRIAES